jgi:hypothetical protein
MPKPYASIKNIYILPISIQPASSHWLAQQQQYVHHNSTTANQSMPLSLPCLAPAKRRLSITLPAQMVALGSGTPCRAAYQRRFLLWLGPSPHTVGTSRRCYSV